MTRGGLILIVLMYVAASFNTKAADVVIVYNMVDKLW
jgi:hypothetical protein